MTCVSTASRRLLSHYLFYSIMCDWMCCKAAKLNVGTVDKKLLVSFQFSVKSLPTISGLFTIDRGGAESQHAYL